MMGRLLHYAADALMVSTILAGIKQTSGITPDITQVSEPNVRQAVHYYLSAGEYIFDKALAFAQSSSHFRPAEPINPLSLFNKEVHGGLRQYSHNDAPSSGRAEVRVPPPGKAPLFVMAPAAPARPPIALAYPADVGAAAPTRLYVLPHPRSGVPTYFAVQDDATYELLVVRPEQRVARSWMLAPCGASSPGHVLRDGALHVLSPMDPALLLLGLLASAWGERRFCPRDDLAEAAAEHHAASRAARMAARTGAAPSAPAWPEIASVLALPAMQEPLTRICATQAEPSALDGLVYRLDEARVCALLDRKVERVLQDAADVIDAQSQRHYGAHASDADVAAARRRVATDLVASYVPLAVEAVWRS
ncbi:hypothetical protein MCAP1_003469 [Malassezia caprae]|uniref:Rnh202 triple barrel domain-containing protein n=1 Tax=Malassezia caprae TaxID=1381934 RepID=A0AAF0E8P0_9BASI|nr:hypothetical protein MCAP1_003469 [Malassezia caprae]